MRCARGDGDGALAAYRRAIALREALVASRPGVPDYQNGLANSYKNLGVILREMGDLSGADAAFRKATELGDALTRSHPDVPTYQIVHAEGWYNWGLLRQQQGQHEEAVSLFGKSLQHLRAARKTAPKRVAILEHLGIAYEGLIRSLRVLNRSEEAAAAKKMQEIAGPVGDPDRGFPADPFAH